MKVRLHVGAAPVLPPGRRRALSALVMGMLAAQSAVALEIDTGNPDWKLRWDNTVKASLMQRPLRGLLVFSAISDGTKS